MRWGSQVNKTKQHKRLQTRIENALGEPSQQNKTTQTAADTYRECVGGAKSTKQNNTNGCRHVSRMRLGSQVDKTKQRKRLQTRIENAFGEPSRQNKTTQTAADTYRECVGVAKSTKQNNTNGCR